MLDSPTRSLFRDPTRRLKRRSNDFGDPERPSLPRSKRVYALALVVVLGIAYLLLSFRRPSSLFASDVPRVDKAVLERLRLLELHDGLDEEDPSVGREGGEVTEGATALESPPPVQTIPDIIKPSPSFPNHVLTTRVPAAQLDAELCPNQSGGCAFLVPAWLGEQETKAQMHLYQLGLLAVSLNRTLVLPKVHKSRFGSCYASPFGFYYAADSLAALGIPSVTHEQFVNWTIVRDPFPTAQVVSISSAIKTYPIGSIEIDSASDPTLVPGKESRHLCLQSPRTRLDFSGYSPLSIYAPSGWQRTEAGRLGFGDSIISTLMSEAVGAKSSRESTAATGLWRRPDVIATNYDLRYKILSPAVVAAFAPHLPRPLPYNYFPYNPRWRQLSSDIATRLAPFVAVHWRTETLAAGNVVPCAAALIKKLVALHTEHPTITNIYLATDYPLESLDPPREDLKKQAVAHSGTFAKSITDQHHLAFKNFLRDFERQTTGLRLTTFTKEYALIFAETASETPVLPATTSGVEALDELPALAESTTALVELDSGLMAIIDKSVALGAEVFLTAYSGSPPGVCGKSSSFTNQIIQSRQAAFDNQTKLAQSENDLVRAKDEEMGGQEAAEQNLVEEGKARVVKGKLFNVVSHWSLAGGIDD